MRWVTLLLVPSLAITEPSGAQSRIVTLQVRSESFRSTSVAVNPIRDVTVYLPAGYDTSSIRYPAIYFFANIEGAPDLFRTGAITSQLDDAIARREIPPVIVVAPDANTSVGTSWYTNSVVTGNWENFIADELVHHIDSLFRTLARRESRGLAGDRMGGYGAIRLGMRRADRFASVYAMHPVGTGSGLQVMHSRPNWRLLAEARSIDEVRTDLFSTIFLSIFQAHLPNPDRAPLYIDLPARGSGRDLTIDAALTDRLRNSFMLETMIPTYASALATLRGFKFDWGRSDWNQDHVYSNQAFAHKLDEYGIAHEAEEYRGAWGERNWGADGRFRTDVIPFFSRALAF
jgi:Putative esterase